MWNVLGVETSWVIVKRVNGLIGGGSQFGDVELDEERGAGDVDEHLRIERTM